MADVMVSPVAALALVGWLNARSQMATVWVATEWHQQMPCVIVTRIGGAVRNVVTDEPTMLIEVYHNSQAEAEDLAEVVQGLVDSLPGETIGGAFVRRVSWLSGPVVYPDANQRTRVQMSFGMTLRRHSI
jgi:hypothetical protein